MVASSRFATMTNDSHHQKCIAWLTVFTIETVAIVTMNALTIIIYLKERILRKRSMYLVISLAVADMFVTYNLIFEILFLGNDCKFWKININRSFEISIVIFSLWYFFPLASVANLAAISLERMHATFRPFKHRLIKKKIFGAAVAGVWFTAALSTAIVFSPFFLGRSDITTIFQGQALYFVLLFCCLLIIVVSYTSIAIKVYCGTHPQHYGKIRRERKLTKTLFIVTTVSLILVMPFTFFCFHNSVTSGEMFQTISYETWLRLFYSLGCLFYANSVINPLLYALKMPEFKRALFLLLRCRYRSEPVQDFPLNDLKVVRFHSVN
ncbi:substance-K receptor-like isoform X1 [Montipora capricornis]|uniref:substance-K receptor-like isoform X1 n=2 Tax=Montipora capricornis TaxID=246305 RepID=UPI0035F1AC4F